MHNQAKGEYRLQRGETRIYGYGKQNCKIYADKRLVRERSLLVITMFFIR